MENTPEDPQEHKDENILKPKRTRTMTEEAKKQYAERMKKVNEDRCEKARLANEAVLEAKEKEIQMKNQAKLDLIAKKKEQIKVAREKNIPDVQPPHHQKEKKQQSKKITKVVYETDSSIEDEETTDESEDEVIYVAKKPSKAKKEVGLVKPKKTNREKEVIQEIPKQIIKFL